MAAFGSDLRATLDVMPAFIMCTASDGEPSFVNRHALEFLGMTEEQVRCAKYAFVHPDDRPAAEQEWEHAVSTGHPYTRTQRLRAADGTYRWFQVRGEPLRGEDQQIQQWWGVWTDVDDRVRAELSLKHSEERLRLIIDTIPALVWSAAPDGTPLYLNQRVLDFTGAKLGDHRDYDWTTTLHPEDVLRTQVSLSESLRTGNPFQILHRLRRADGEYRWMDARGEALKDERGGVICWYGIDFDVHERIQLQEAIAQAQARLAKASEVAMVAEVSASLAHEINQPLAAIASNAHACQRWLMSEPPNLERAHVTADRVRRDALSAADLVERIRKLFQQAPPSCVPIDLNAAIRQTLELVADRLDAHRITVRSTLADALPAVRVDPVQLQQVLVNLIANAIEAMESAQQEPRCMELRSYLSTPQDVTVEVCDNGAGIIDPDRIFEPFYSTKAQGMGMGLAVCRSIVEAHGGRLSARANPARGSTFHITLSLQDESP